MNSLPPDPYKILGVSRDAQTQEIRSAHRKLVLKCHPDKVQDAALKAVKQDEFQRVQQAYELLIDDNERAKYDDQVKLMDLRKEMQKNMGANTSSPRTPPQSRYYEVRTAEPRPDSFKAGPPRTPHGTAVPKMYAQQYPKSWDEDIHNSTRIFEEAPRSTRRAASYEKGYEKPSKRDDERERERDRRRRKEDEEERDRLARQAEKEFRRAEKKKLEKDRERDRKREAEDKRRHKSPYVEPYEDDEAYHASKSDKKKSSSSTRKHEEKETKRERERSTPREEIPASKMDSYMVFAASYMESARQKGQPVLNRAHTFQDQTSNVRYAVPPAAVPTPPTAAPAPFPPPSMMPDEDVARRSSAKVSARRASHDTPKSKDKVSHKKSSSGPKDSPDPTPPIIIDAASPSTRHPPAFARPGAVPTVPASPPRKGGLPRANTMNEGAYSRQAPVPAPMSRAHTFNAYTPEAEPRGRSRSKLQSQVLTDDEDSEDERRRERKHRSGRQKTHSPEPISSQYAHPPPPRHHTRYTVNEGRTVPVAGYYRDESPLRKPGKSGYYNPQVRVMEAHPGMPPRDSSYTSTGGGNYFSKVKTAKNYTPDDVQYSAIPHSGYREEAFGYA